MNLRCEVEGLTPQEAQVRIALVALAVIGVAIVITASALNAIATSKSETELGRNDTDWQERFSTASFMSLCRKARKHFPQS